MALVKTNPSVKRQLNMHSSLTNQPTDHQHLITVLCYIAAAALVAVVNTIYYEDANKLVAQLITNLSHFYKKRMYFIAIKATSRELHG